MNDDDLVRIDDTLPVLGIADIAFRNIGELSGGQRQLASLAQTSVTGSAVAECPSQSTPLKPNELKHGVEIAIESSARR